MLLEKPIMMKKIIILSILILAIFSITTRVYGQCKSFAKKMCKVELQQYIHDGNYNAAVLTEGEDAELYKTFYAGQQYRIVVCGSDALPRIQFQILDLSRKVLFDNKKNNYVNKWDFELESSQQLVISVKVEESAATTEDFQILSGCVSIMFGILDE